ncbi:MAG: AI-2E family transporter [Elusimicrobiota bacterium]|jgi:AI-2 transport protein TqsA|nr:AI-2E family transporter [Elusimicrobiota bacterium]
MNNPFKRGPKAAPAPVKSGAEVYRNINTACIIAIAAVCITMALIYTKTILVPLVISVFIYTMMTPVIRFLHARFRLPRWLALITASLLAGVLLVALVIFMIHSVTNLIQVAGAYNAKLLQAFNWVANFFKGYNLPFAEDINDLQGIISLMSSQHVGDIVRVGAGFTFKILSYSALVLIFVFFLLMGNGRSPASNTVLREMQNKISAYLFIHILLSLLTGVTVGIVYFSAGLELATMFAVLTVILNFIPNVGSIIAVLLPLPIALIQYGFGPQFWVVLIIPSCLQFAIGSILEPKLLGSGLDLHPVAVIGSLIFWALVWGIPGAFLAAPITSAIRVILSQFEPTRPFAEILAGRLPK